MFKLCLAGISLSALLLGCDDPKTIRDVQSLDARDLSDAGDARGAPIDGGTDVAAMPDVSQDVLSADGSVDVVDAANPADSTADVVNDVADSSVSIVDVSPSDANEDVALDALRD